MKTKIGFAIGCVLAGGVLFVITPGLAQDSSSASTEGAAPHAGEAKAAEPKYEDIGFGRCSPEDAKKALREFFEGYENYETKNKLVKLKAGENSLYLTRSAGRGVKTFGAPAMRRG